MGVAVSCPGLCVSPQEGWQQSWLSSCQWCGSEVCLRFSLKIEECIEGHSGSLCHLPLVRSGWDPGNGLQEGCRLYLALPTTCVPLGVNFQRAWTRGLHITGQ